MKTMVGVIIFFGALAPPLAVAVAIIVMLLCLTGHAVLNLARDLRAFMRGD